MRKTLLVVLFLTLWIAGCGAASTPAAPATAEVLPTQPAATATVLPTETLIPPSPTTAAETVEQKCTKEKIQAELDSRIGTNIFWVTYVVYVDGHCQVSFTYFDHPVDKTEWDGLSYEYFLQNVVPGEKIEVWYVQGDDTGYTWQKNKWEVAAGNLIGYTVNISPVGIFTSKIENLRSYTPTVPTLTAPITPTP